jgi:CBS domain containing-hemolysin-like protein
VEPDGSVILEGLMRLDEFEEQTGIRLDPIVREEVDTLGGLVMAVLGRIPDVGDEMPLNAHTLRVEALDGRRVAAVRLMLADSAAAETPVGAAAANGSRAEQRPDGFN